MFVFFSAFIATEDDMKENVETSGAYNKDGVHSKPGSVIPAEDTLPQEQADIRCNIE